jgi:hypothetical protein
LIHSASSPIMAAFQFHMPAFAIPPIAVIADEDAPTRPEVTAFRGQVDTWSQEVFAQLVVMNPAHGFTLAMPTALNAAPDPATLLGKLAALRFYCYALLPVYTMAYTGLQAALAGAPAGAAAAAAVAAAIPAAVPAPVLPRPRVPKVELPARFAGKTTTLARAFIRQCNNYAALIPFDTHDAQIRWTLQLMEGDALLWANEQLDLIDDVAPPPHLLNYALFQDEFLTRWTDPHAMNKAVDLIMSGAIAQKTSVKAYNDQFNEVLTLSGELSTNNMILRMYHKGLKPAVQISAIPSLRATPGITFADRQAMMVGIDEDLMQVRAATRATSSAPPPRARPQYVVNIQTPVDLTSPSPAPQSRQGTPIKVEAARQFTKLTPEERQRLRDTNACFYCRAHGHRAAECPNKPVRVAAIATPAPAAPAPAAPVPNPTPVPVPVATPYAHITDSASPPAASLVDF